jgi:hypothetical protein
LGHAESCLAKLAALELVEDAGLLRGRFAASCCALRARSSWHISIRDGDKKWPFRACGNDWKYSRNSLLAAGCTLD